MNALKINSVGEQFTFKIRLQLMTIVYTLIQHNILQWQ